MKRPKSMFRDTADMREAMQVIPQFFPASTLLYNGGVEEGTFTTDFQPLKEHIRSKRFQDIQRAKVTRVTGGNGIPREAGKTETPRNLPQSFNQKNTAEVP